MITSAETYNLQNSADPWEPLVIYQVVIVFYVSVIILVSLSCAAYCSYDANNLFCRLSSLIFYICEIHIILDLGIIKLHRRC